MLETLGAPVTDAQGNNASKIAVILARVCDLTEEVICHTVGYFSISNSERTLTEPVSEIFPISFLSMSVIIIFSALSFSEFFNSVISAISSFKVLPLFEVPFIGLHMRDSSLNLKKSSGDVEIIVCSSDSMNAAYGASCTFSRKNPYGLAMQLECFLSV